MPRRLPPSACGHLARHRALAVVVDAEHSLDDAQRDILILRNLDQRPGVLGKAGAAETGAGMQKFRADAVIHANAARDLLHVRADLFGQIGDLVDEGDLGRKKRVGGIFDQLGRTATGVHDRRLIERQRAINLAQHLAGALVRCADDNAVRKLEVTDRRAFAQEFRVGGHGEIGSRIGFADQ